MRGTNVAVVPEDEMVDALVDWADFIMEHGIERALERSDIRAAKSAAEADRSALFDQKGPDVNASGQRIETIRKLTK